MADPQIIARGLIGELDHPATGRLKQIAPTVKLSATPGEMHAPPPELGEHTRAILSELGYPPTLIEQWAQAGVITASA